MNLRKRPNSPYWWYDFKIGNERHRKSTRRLLSDRSGAQAYMVAEYQRLQDINQFGTRKQLTLLEACQKTNKTVEGSTRTSYKLSMRKLCGLDIFSGPEFWSLDPNMPISELKTFHVSELKTERSEEGLKSNTVNIEIRYIQRVYNLCLEEWDCEVTAGVKFKKLKGFEKTRWLSMEEERNVLELLNEPSIAKKKAANLMVFLTDTGVRIQEALGVTWQDVNLSDKSIEIFRGKTSTVSAVPMSDRVHDMLLSLQADFDKPFDAMSKAIKHLRLAISEVCNTDERIVAQRGAATIHSLRDTFASRLAQNGMSLHQVSKLLGHSSTTMTRKYAHLESSSMLSQARDLLNR